MFANSTKDLSFVPRYSLVVFKLLCPAWLATCSILYPALCKALVQKYARIICGCNFTLLHEEQELIKRLSENDNDIETKQKLIEGNYKLMLSILNKYKTENENVDDLICVAVIVLIKAINTFANIKEIKLTYYITKCIENEINLYLQLKH